MFLYEKETITGEEFMKILNNKEESEENEKTFTLWLAGTH